MFLHLGVDTIVPLAGVIAILDIKIAKSSTTADYIKRMRENKKIEVINISENDAKSFVITEKAVYFSTISSLTLKKRAGVLPSLKI